MLTVFRHVMFVGLNPWKHRCKTDRCLKDCAVTLTDCWLHQCYIFHVWKGLLMFGERKLEMAGGQTERDVWKMSVFSDSRPEVLSVCRCCCCLCLRPGFALWTWTRYRWLKRTGRPNLTHIWHIKHKNNRQNRKFSCIWQQHLHFLVHCYWNIHSQPLY